MIRFTRQLFIFIMTSIFTSMLLTGSLALAQRWSLGWWTLPDAMDEWPQEAEEDDQGAWTEIWLRPPAALESDVSVTPNGFMEQGLGFRWAAFSQEKEGKPGSIWLVVNKKHVVQWTPTQVHFGDIIGGAIHWADTKQIQKLIEFRHHRHHRRHHTKINFGRISIPPLSTNEPQVSVRSVAPLGELFSRLSTLDSNTSLTPYDLRALAKLSDEDGGELNVHYNKCSSETENKLERLMDEYVEPRLSCWMEQNPEKALHILGVLLQKPTIECVDNSELGEDICGSATVPVENAFFINGPLIRIATKSCSDDMGETLLHEFFHLAGLHDDSPEITSAREEAASCAGGAPDLDYSYDGDTFYNDLQVESRMTLFHLVRDQAVDRWGWTPSEQSFVLGNICARMGDKFCARRFFQMAADGGMTGMVELPEGGQVTWSSLAQYDLFDSIVEEIPRMHELVQYLRRDPFGTLLRRSETPDHRLHEMYVAREALQDVKDNHGVCNSDTDEHIMCEDLAQLIKTPWFRKP